MEAVDAAAYFAVRAPRYQSALRGCPGARGLDLVPYAAGFEASGITNFQGKRGCDAFGGTGFLARPFSELGMSIVVADVCEEMLEGAKDLKGVETHVTEDDFGSLLSEWGPSSFDFVFSHGGLHHVVDATGGTVDIETSRGRQSRLIARLARLLRPGGVLFLVDIPESAPAEKEGVLAGASVSVDWLTALTTKAGHIPEAMKELWGNGRSLTDLRREIEARLWTALEKPIPRHFFDAFIAKAAPMGHVAVYPDFDELDCAVLDAGLELIGRVNYRGPWVFASPAEAGWFFREKFSLFDAAKLGEEPGSEHAVWLALQEYLGAQAVPGLAAVNWGVTYAVYRQGFESHARGGET